MSISEKQLAANRANAARSTGPTSPAGKAHSSQNARKHGFASARLESGLFTSCMNESFGPEGSPTLPFRQELAEGIEITRLYRRAVEEFERLKKLRPELPSEPISEDDQPSEPEENTTDPSSPGPTPNEPIPRCGAGCQPADRMSSGRPAEGRCPSLQRGNQPPAPKSPGPNP